MCGLAFKLASTWFLGGRGGPSAAFFFKFHFETANTIQLTYTAGSNWTHGLAWFINTAYIIYVSHFSSTG
jgi:hypothetical protein